ncbi:MAG: lectin-like protein, partial [Candidatus Marinimicrobia bacterium]|nr:lectin-like protein [Candidatus Neomarinimicrobiota bacterium]
MRIKLLSLLFLISFATGQGSSLSFDGVNDYVSIANNSAFEPSSFTVQAWINLSAFENEDYFVYRHKTWFIGFSRSGTKFEGGVRDDDGDWLYPKSSTTPSAGGGWYHVVLTFDNGSTDDAKIYINGSLEDTESASSHTLNSQTSVVAIGAKYNNGAENYFNGQVDEVAFWDVALTADEITALYNSGNYSESSSDLQGYWNFNEGTGTTLTDQTSNGNNGTINGATWSTETPVKIAQVAAMEHDETQGIRSSIAHVSGNVYVMAYKGSGNDGYIKTFTLADNGTIAQISSVAHDTQQGTNNSIVKVDGTLYALAYSGYGDDGFLKTFTIPDDGSTITTVSQIEHDTNYGGHNSLTKVDANTVALAYAGPGYDGYIKTFDITSSGAVITQLQSLEHDIINGTYNSFIKMDAQTYVLAYTGHGNDGYIQTFTIPADGSSITQVKQLEHNTKYSSWNSLIQVDHNTYALAYHGNDGTDSHGTLTTFTIPLGGSSITEVATLKHAITGGWGRYHSLLKLNSDEYALAFSYIDEIGYVKTFTISDDGETIAEQWSVLHDTNQGIWNDLIRIDKDTYALSYSGDGDDGFIKTFDIATADAAAPSYSIIVTHDNSSVTVVFDEPVYASYSGGTASGALTAGDFAFSLNSGSATLSSATPLSILENSGYIYTLGLGLNGTPDGSEILAVNIASTIYDASGNAASTSGNNTETLNAIVQVSALEHDVAQGQYHSMAHVSGNVYVMAYGGSGTDGYIKTFTLADNGAVTPITVMEHDDSYGIYNSIVKVDGTLYALAYTGPSSYGYIKTFYISDDGSTIETKGISVHDNSTTMWNSMVQVDANTVALAYDSNNPAGGIIKTFDISGAGAVITQTQALEHDVNFGLTNSFIKMDAETYALAYSGHGWDGYISTFTIPVDGSSITKVDEIEHNTSFAQHNSFVQVDYNTYALAYYGSDGGNYGLIQTFTIPLNGYGITEVASLKHETNSNTGTYNSFIKLNSGQYALAYTGYESDGYLKIFTISSDGASIAEQGSLEYDKNYGTWNELIVIDKNTCALAYSGDGYDGFIKTFDIEAPDAAGPTYAIAIATDNDNVSVVFNEPVYSTNAASGTLTASDFSLSISGGSASVSGSPTGIAASSGYIFTLGLDLSGTPDGTEVLTVDLANAVYDANGNAASSSQDNNTVNLNEKVPPTVTATTLAAFNTTINVTFSEAVFASYNSGTGVASGSLEADDFVFSMSGGDAVLASTTPSSISTSSFSNIGYYNGHYYYRSNSTATWSDAKTACENAGGHLVVITSRAENDFIKTNLGLSNHVWIGLSDEATEGTHVWVTGETFSYSNWHSGQPNNDPTQDHGGMYYNTGTWWDDHGTDSYYYVLESSSPIANVYTLGINYSGLPSGYEVLTVSPAENAVYDRGGNAASTTQSNNQQTFTEEKIRMAASLEHNTSQGNYNSLVKIDGDTYAVAYAGSGNDGYIQTFTIPADGSAITKVNRIEHNGSSGRWNSFLKIDEDTYALAYAGYGDDGFLTTFTISADGSTITAGSQIEHDNSYGAYNSLIQLGADTYVLAYLSSNSDGWIKMFTITADGTKAQVSQLEHDTNGGSYNSLVKVDANTVALAYAGSSGNGYIKTFNILADSSITEVYSYMHDGTQANHNSFVQADSNTYVLAYSGADDDGFISTFTISSSGAITPVKTKALGNNLEHDTAQYFTLSPSALSKISGGSDTYILAYGGEDTNDNGTPDGYIKTFTIPTDGSAITQTYVLEHDIDLGTNTSLVQIDEDSYVLAYAGGEGHASWDGYIKTFSVRASDQVAPTFTSVSLAADNSTIAVTLDELVFTSSDGSGSLETGDFALSISGG